MAETFKLVLKSRLFETVEVRNIFYLHTSGAPDTQALISDFDGYLTAMCDPLKSVCTSAWRTYQYDIHRWAGGEVGWAFLVSYPYSKAGTTSGDCLPAQVAAAMTMYTAVKRTFSRKFWAGLSESTQAGGILTSGAVTILTDIAGHWLADYTGGDAVVYVPGLWSKNNTFVPFIQGVVNEILGTMVRRKPGIGI